MTATKEGVPISKAAKRLATGFLLALTTGIPLALFDLTQSSNSSGLIAVLTIGLYILASGVFGYIYRKQWWIFPLIYAITLYSVHVLAIQMGVKTPYVERSAEDALVCLLVALPSLFGVAIGSLSRWAIDEQKASEASLKS